ncbi:MAG TPA: lysylphosphatidylglycerol synthase domain-containing protein [Burkholderiales bacterium]|nr:lysylphosphatidylglycerol synthase domain-containing protein [Burkholderiales bacterium]
MRIGSSLIALVGFALAIYLVGREGFEAVFQALNVAGWTGLGAITLFHALPTVLCGIAWWLLLRHHTSEGWAVFSWVRWLRDGVDGVLPIVPVSGEMVGVRILALRGLRLAGASVIVDMTAELLGQTVFAVIGFVLLFAIHPDSPYLLWVALGIVAMGVEFVGFLIAQRKGLFRFVERLWRRRKKDPQDIDDRTLHDHIITLYNDPWDFLGCICIHLLAWIVGAFEAWLGLWFMGQPLDIGRVLAIESLIYALRSVTFFVPLGAGVQEGGYVLIGGLFGLGPDLALAISLLKRARDLIIGLPAILVWHHIERRNMARNPAS